MRLIGERQAADVAARLDRMEGCEAIHRLMHNYSHAFDKRDLQQFMALWADDAVWSIGPGHEARDRAAIEEAAEGLWRDIPATHHWPTNSVIDVDGDQASAVSDAHAVAQDPDGTWTQTAATYRDTFRRVDGSWVFESRVTEIHRAWPVDDSVS
jgi:uncharacterized protein (TIGR02246 family)